MRKVAPFNSRIASSFKGHTDLLDKLAVEMYARGLSTRDIEDTLVKAAFPKSVRIRCWFHRMRNLQGKVPQEVWPDIKTELVGIRTTNLIERSFEEEEVLV